MNTFEWESGTVVERPYIEIDGTKHYLQSGTVSGGTPVTAENLNEMQTILNGNIPMPNIITDGAEVRLPYKVDNKWVYVKRFSSNFPNQNIEIQHNITNFYPIDMKAIAIKNNIWRNSLTTEIDSTYIYYYGYGSSEKGSGYIDVFFVHTDE